jgi:wyosine [tRNA(Phe)-imidazoG37] synthetase (radical SAM superfamily)
VDLVPFKACPYDCVYCQLGPTRTLTCDRGVFAPVGVLVKEIERALEKGPAPDAITLAGSGEPTLYWLMGKLIAALKGITDIPVVLLTNGSLFWDAGVRKEAALADRVLPSLDAGDASTFRAVNRPHPDLGLDLVVAGMEAFRIEFAGPVWLEVMVVAGLNDHPDQIRAIADKVLRIRPDRIHLNTPVRPSPLGLQAVVPEERLRGFCSLFTPEAEVVADFKPAPNAVGVQDDGIGKRLLELLSRRPCTVEDASRGLSAAPNEVVKALATLEADGRVRRENQGPRLFFEIQRNGGSP